tara:strand:- start:774 stop:995 length:222 start_codon:yes stop_codon:yes gene_type:complete
MRTSDPPVSTDTVSTSRDDAGEPDPEASEQQATWTPELFDQLVEEGRQAAAELRRRMAPMHHLTVEDLLRRCR